MDKVREVTDQIDWSIVISTVAAAVIIGGSVYAMRKAGLKTAANIISAGK